MNTFKDPHEGNGRFLILVQSVLSWGQHYSFFISKSYAGIGQQVLSPWRGRASYLEQDDHCKEHVEASKGKRKEATLGIWHIKGRVFFEGPIPEAVT